MEMYRDYDEISRITFIEAMNLPKPVREWFISNPTTNLIATGTQPIC